MDPVYNCLNCGKPMVINRSGYTHCNKVINPGQPEADDNYGYHCDTTHQTSAWPNSEEQIGWIRYMHGGWQVFYPMDADFEEMDLLEDIAFAEHNIETYINMLYHNSQKLRKLKAELAQHRGEKK